MLNNALAVTAVVLASGYVLMIMLYFVNMAMQRRHDERKEIRYRKAYGQLSERSVAPHRRERAAEGLMLDIGVYADDFVNNLPSGLGDVVSGAPIRPIADGGLDAFGVDKEKARQCANCGGSANYYVSVGDQYTFAYLCGTCKADIELRSFTATTEPEAFSMGATHQDEQPSSASSS